MSVHPATHRCSNYHNTEVLSASFMSSKFYKGMTFGLCVFRHIGVMVCLPNVVFLCVSSRLTVTLEWKQVRQPNIFPKTGLFLATVPTWLKVSHHGWMDCHLMFRHTLPHDFSSTTSFKTTMSLTFVVFSEILDGFQCLPLSG